MPESTALAATGADPVEAASVLADRGLVRSVRRRLVLWSGGVTLLILVVLGSILYVTVANSLAANGTQQLEVRAKAITDSLRGPGAGPPLGFAFGGRSSGTIAFLVDPSDRVIGPPGLEMPGGLPDAGSVKAARTSGHDVRTTTVSDVPVRILSDDVPSQTGTFVIQVVADRTAEQQTLDVLATVLVVGGLLAVVVATGFGAVYARRALVPIRDSLDAQRVALRRQREFAADASHELRTPLTVVRTSIEHLERHRDEPVGAVGTALDDIRTETDHLTHLVDDLLLLARSDSGAVELETVPVDLSEVAAEAAAGQAGPAEAHGVTFALDLAPIVTSGDPMRLRQLLLILIDNAIRHGPAGSEVRIAVRADGRDAVVEVEDAGRGVRPEEMPHIFERFWQAPDAPEGGTGLGLSIAAWIVERHGGTIRVDNRDEGGARFSVR
ncbi:MAG TPA: HAMP domain-containing sensor histidine kinase, partial [Candidatus Limnocylindrales bacterium]